VRVYKDTKFNNTVVLVEMPKGRKILGPYSGMPMPMFRWSSLLSNVEYITFSGGGATFTIRITTHEKGVVEEVMATSMTTFSDALAAGIEGFQWEGWNPALKAWEIQARPAPFQWTGNDFQMLTWRDE
jgi:hypothetical protein